LLSWLPTFAFEQLKEHIAAPLFMEVIIMLSWSIWTTRKNFIFNEIQPTIQLMKASFVHESLPWISIGQSKILPRHQTCALFFNI